MDRNNRARRHKQQTANVRRQHDPHRMNAQTRQRPQQAPPPRQTAYTDHAPLYDQDDGRTPAPQQAQPQRGRRRITKKELRRRARRRRMLAVLFVLLAITAGALFSVSFLFKVTDIVVSNPNGSSELVAINQTNVIPVTPVATAAPTPIPEGQADSVIAQPEEGAQSGTEAVPEGDGTSTETVPTPTPAVPLDTGPYSTQQIAAALGVQPGDNLFSFNIEQREQQMDLALPLLEQIELRRRYPNTVEICVTPAAGTYSLQTDTGWLVLSRSLKVMELAAEQPAGLTMLYADAVASTPGTTLVLKDEVASLITDPALSQPVQSSPVVNVRESLQTLLTGLETYGMLDQVSAVDIANPEETAFLFDNRICVHLGTLNELDYKLQLAAYIVLNKNGDGCSATDIGDLDCSYIRSDGTIQPVFRQGTPMLPSQQAALDADQPQATPAPSNAPTVPPAIKKE
ncbi:MAG: FtsQ-type POTRA domain-containing protein [Faecalibacterium sp.]|nr:FtsQ-type POTRA domain-containing protein [Faecalibacterium sp.]